MTTKAKGLRKANFFLNPPELTNIIAKGINNISPAEYSTEKMVRRNNNEITAPRKNP